MTKRILITGKNSYIGTSFIEYCHKNNIGFDIDELSVHGDEWKQEDFSKYDAVLHVAGIAHNSSDPKLEDLYYEVNRNLTIQVAQKAKSEGVSQFIFMSSIIVFGTKNEMIDENTKPNPDNFYGDSKLQAENGLKVLISQDFKVAIVRPPMIYGKGSKGNYPLLSRLARKTPVFPDYDNKRSMLHIDNLCSLLSLIIKNEESGNFHPQNPAYVKTSDMVKSISIVHGKKIWMIKLFNPVIKLASNVNIINKVFGNLYYEMSMSQHFNVKYQINNLEESIVLTEGE